MFTIKSIFLILYFFIFSISQNTYSNELEYEDYDSIVARLKQSPSKRQSYSNPFHDVQIHTGIGITSSRISLRGDDIPTESGFLKGVEATLGIDLFSRIWMAEGSVRSFSEERFTYSRVSLKEFDLKFIRRSPLGRSTTLRIGFGIAARYLDYFNDGSKKKYAFVAEANQQPPIQRLVKTPSSIFLIGASSQLTKIISIGAEMSLRSSMIRETLEESALQGSLRMDIRY